MGYESAAAQETIVARNSLRSCYLQDIHQQADILRIRKPSRVLYREAASRLIEGRSLRFARSEVYKTNLNF